MFAASSVFLSLLNKYSIMFEMAAQRSGSEREEEEKPLTKWIIESCMKVQEHVRYKHGNYVFLAKPMEWLQDAC